MRSATTTRTAERAAARRWAGLGLLLAAGLVLLASAARPAPALVVRDDGGGVVARAQLPPDRRFALSYRHSVYDEPAVEHFVAEPGGAFRLVEISSASEAVLDYYALAGERRRDGEGWHLVPPPTEPLDALPLIGTAIGERTLEVGTRRLPLHTEGGAVHLTLDLEV